jgi:hypothetical protein
VPELAAFGGLVLVLTLLVGVLAWGLGRRGSADPAERHEMKPSANPIPDSLSPQREEELVRWVGNLQGDVNSTD